MAQSPSACLDTEAGKIAKVVLFPGDPLRAKVVAETYLENAECFNSIRGMFGFTGLYRGRRISVMGSGMGIPSATLYAHELYNLYGVDSIIRIGTAGAVSPDVRVRDLVIAMSASTNSNFSAQYEFPGLLAIDMETAGIYWEAMASGKRALSVLTASNHILTGEETPADERLNAFTDMMEVALETAWSVAAE